jgi:hypothetical protein
VTGEDTNSTSKRLREAPEPLPMRHGRRLDVGVVCFLHTEVAADGDSDHG